MQYQLSQPDGKVNATGSDLQLNRPSSAFVPSVFIPKVHTTQLTWKIGSSHIQKNPTKVKLTAIILYYLFFSHYNAAKSKTQ